MIASPLHRCFGLELDRHAVQTSAGRFRLSDAVRRHRVVRVRDLELTESAQLELTASLGAVVGQRQGITMALRPNVRYETGADRFAHRWHADQSWASTDAWSLLFCIEAVENAVPTEFVDSSTAMESIDVALLTGLNGATVLHDVINSRRIRPAGDDRARSEPLSARAMRRAQRAAQKLRLHWSASGLLDVAPATSSGTRYPLIDQCPWTGATHLRVGDHAWSISGRDESQTDELLGQMHDSMGVEDNVLAVSWRPGDLVVYDNRVVLHRRAPSGRATSGRLLRRTLAVPSLENG